MKIALTIEQMKTLIKLGVDVSNAQFSYVCGGLKWLDRACRETTEMDYIPALTLTDLLEILPKEPLADYCLQITNWRNDIWYVGYTMQDEDPLIMYNCSELIDGLYKLVIWCIEHGYIETE